MEKYENERVVGNVVLDEPFNRGASGEGRERAHFADKARLIGKVTMKTDSKRDGFGSAGRFFLEK